MSTKIYYAVVIEGCDSPMAFSNFSKELKKKIEVAMIEKFYDLVARRMTYEIDFSVCLPNHQSEMNSIEEISKGPRETMLRLAQGYVLDKIQEAEKSEKNNPFFDIGCDFRVYFYDKIYVIPISSCEKYTNILIHMPNARDYSFWNNTDQPDEISEEDWYARGAKWNYILDRAPLELKVDPWYTIAPVQKPDEEFLKRIPSKETRIREMTNKLAFVKLSNEFDNINASNVMSLFNNPKLKEYQEEFQSEVENKLPEITRKLITSRSEYMKLLGLQ